MVPHVVKVHLYLKFSKVAEESLCGSFHCFRCLKIGTVPYYGVNPNQGAKSKRIFFCLRMAVALVPVRILSFLKVDIKEDNL